jgi:exonuclease SbcD
MRILHTGDWHVGRTLRGRSRAEEHRRVLAEIRGIAQERDVDLILVAGDLFDSATPTPEAEQIVYGALIDLAATGAPIVLVAGNHDNPHRLQAVRPLLELTHVHTAVSPMPAGAGGLRRIATRRGEAAAIALLPFVSQRSIVRAEDLMRADAADHVASYADRMCRIVEALCAALPDDTVNLMLAHVMVHGGVLGGGERLAHTVFDYGVPSTAFAPELHVAALGHLHRAQELPGACRIRYCGSPLQLDFGEAEDAKSVDLIDAVPGRPPTIVTVPLQEGRRLVTLRGSPDEVLSRTSELGDAYLRIELDAEPQVGLADHVRRELPGAVEVRVVRRREEGDAPRRTRAGRSPQELFAEYLAQRDATDEGLQRLFAELLEEAHAPSAA